MYSLQRFTPFGKRDVLMELKKACEAAGIKFCLYYSILDWSHSSQEINHSNGSTYSTMKSDSARTAYIRDMKAQLKELIDRYHPASVWFDGDWTYNAGKPTLEKWWTKDDGVDLYNYLIGLDPTWWSTNVFAAVLVWGITNVPSRKCPMLRGAANGRLARQ